MKKSNWGRVEPGPFLQYWYTPWHLCQDVPPIDPQWWFTFGNCCVFQTLTRSWTCHRRDKKDTSLLSLIRIILRLESQSLWGWGNYLSFFFFSTTSRLIHQDSRKNQRIVLCHLLSWTAQLVWQSATVISLHSWGKKKKNPHATAMAPHQLWHPCCALMPWGAGSGRGKGQWRGFRSVLASPIASTLVCIKTI